jgi:hypothetical protein
MYHGQPEILSFIPFGKRANGGSQGAVGDSSTSFCRPNADAYLWSCADAGDSFSDHFSITVAIPVPRLDLLSSTINLDNFSSLPSCLEYAFDAFCYF